MINILFIHQSAELYGSDKTLLLLLSKLDKTKFNPIVMLPYYGNLNEELEKQNIKVVVAPVLKLYRKMFTPKGFFIFFKQIKKAITILDKLNKEYNFEIIYSNTLAVLLGMIYAKKRKIKHIWHVHEIIVHPKIIAHIFPKLLDKYADIVVCNSNATKDNLILRVNNLDKKTIVIHNGLEQNHFDFIKIKKEDLGFENNDLLIALIGRINRLKGHKLLLNVFIKNFSHLDNLKLLFVGSPVVGQENHLHEVEEIIKHNNLDKKVKILPFIKELDAIFGLTDIVVVPSTEAESFGLVALEAMLARKPVIASNHGGLTEIVLNGETGYLVKPNDDNELYDAIQKLIENPTLREEFGKKGCQRAIKEFSVEKYVSSFEALFNRMILSK